jgi:predicted GIY-YIG superfamily endonuclease
MLYLLHFDPRYRHAGHYLGYTQELPKRFGLHLQGKGSPLVKAAINNGSQIVLVRIWAEDGNAEQEIKRVIGSRAKLCPLCNPKAKDVMKSYKSVLVSFSTVEMVRRAAHSVAQTLKRPSTAATILEPATQHIES